MTQFIKPQNGGGQGGGQGDMQKSVYDPNNVEANAFDYDNFINKPDLSGYQTTANLVTDLDDADNTHYPSSLAVKNAITSAGGGDVTGPNSSTDGDIVLFDGVTGKIIKDGSKALSDLVQTSGNQTINGTKTYTTSPVVPSKTTDATNTGTTIATEAQVYAKQDKLTAGSNITITNNTISATDTTYSSLSPASGGTDVSLVTTGEKYTWNNKQDAINDLATIRSGAALGATSIQPNDNVSSLVNDAGYLTSSALAGKATETVLGLVKLGSNTVQSVAANAVTSEGSRTYAVQLNSSDQMVVNVPWQNTIQAVDDHLDTTSLNPVQNVVITNALSGKQATLVSGTNIKSVNNNSLLGSGDLNINDIKVSATAPSSPTAGTVWYDTTNNLLKSYNGSAWSAVGAVLSVNGQTGAVTVAEFSPSNAGSTGNILTKTANGYEWNTAPESGIGISTQANNILTSGAKIRVGTQANYNALGTKSNNTIYLTI